MSDNSCHSRLPRQQTPAGVSLGGGPIVLVLGLAIALPVAAETGDPAAVAARQERVAELVSDLAASSRATRSAAHAGLLQLGPSILELLPPAELLTDAAARESVKQIRRQLEAQLVEEHLQPSRVTFQGEASLRELLEIVAAQSGNSIAVEATLPPARLDRRLSIHWSDENYWTAITQICRELGADVAPVSRPAGVALVRHPDDSPPLQLAAAGPFLVRLNAMDSKLIEQSGQPRRLLRLSCTLIAEPRLKPLFADVPAGNFRVLLGDVELSPFNPGAVQSFDFGSGVAVDFRHDCLAPADLALDALPLQMSGTLLVDIAALPQPIHFRDLVGRHPVTRRCGEATITLLAITEIVPPAAADDEPLRSADLHILTQYDTGGPAFESYRLSALFRDVRLELPSGETRNADEDLLLTREQNGAVAARYHFQGLPAEWNQGTLVAVTPLATPRVEVPFTLKTASRETATRAEASP